MPPDPWLGHAKSMIQTAAGLAPVPGLKEGVDALCAFIGLCEDVSENRNAIRELCKQCYRLLIKVEKYQPQPGPNTRGRAFQVVTRCITDVHDRVKKWAKTSWLGSLVHLKAIKNDLEASRGQIAECFLEFQLAVAGDTGQWQADFAAAVQADHEEVIAYLSEIQDGQEIVKELIRDYGDKILLEQKIELREMTEKIMKFMQESMGDLKTSSTNQYVAISKILHDLQTSEKTLLPNLHLVSGEITDVENQAVYATASMDIYRGCYLHREKVAIKVIRVVNANEKTDRRFRREGEIWKCIYNMDHGRYILPFYGFGQGIDLRPFMVSPWQENGNALSYVKENDMRVSYKQMIIDIAEGLKLLHTLVKPRRVVHGDIRAENIFINSQGNPLIGDFGLSKMVDDMTDTPFTQSNSAANLCRWFAPEVYTEEGIISFASDVYSFGMTVLELYTHEYPYSKIKHPQGVVLVVAKGQTPPRPNDAEVSRRGFDENIWKLLLECWSPMASARPTITDILERLRL
ncbi:kinase-like protein [Marasmius fiardii PR-910]|nr:kinase-like protein [Marasmius fiardii PR-910]